MKKTVLILLFFIATSSAAHSQITSWDGSSWSLGAPNSTTDAIIASSVSPGSFTAKDLTISATYSLTINQGDSVTLHGNLTNAGNGVSGKGILKFSNTLVNQKFLDGSFNFLGVIKVVSGATLETGGLLTLGASSASNYGIITGSGTVTGNVTVNAWLDLSGSGNDGRFYHLGSPVRGTTLSDFNGDQALVSANDATGSIWEWDASNAEWDPAGSGSLSSSVVQGKGYVIYAGTNSNDTYLRSGPGTIDMVGMITMNDTTIALTYNDGQSASVTFASGTTTEDTEGWNLIANPYTAVLDWNVQDDHLPANLEGAYYVWDGFNYLSYVSGAGSAGRYISPFQAFFVQLDANSPGNFTFKQSARVSDQTPELRKISSPAFDGISLTVSSVQENVQDEVYVGFEPEATESYDSEWDARKLRNANHVPNIYVHHLGQNYSVFKTSPADSAVYELNLDYPYSDHMQLSADISGLQSYRRVLLTDLKTGKKTELNNTEVYDFVNDSGYNGSRFSLTFTNSVATQTEGENNVEELSFKLNQNYPNPFNPTTTIPLNLNKPAHVRVTIFDSLGRLVDILYKGQLASGKYEWQWDASERSGGIYYYRVQTNEHSVTKPMVLLK